jgi:hypothetical protein
MVAKLVKRGLLFFFECAINMTMQIEISFSPSAFKHGVSEEDIRWALGTQFCDVLMEGYEDKYILIGFDMNGNLLEIMYRAIDNHSIHVFHAMKCRKALRSQFGL